MKRLENLVVKKWDEFVKVQPHMVISRVLIDDESKKVMIFAFDKGEDVNSEIYSKDMLYSVLNGSLIVYLDEESYILNDGMCIQVPANMPHGLKAERPTKFLMISEKGEK